MQPARHRRECLTILAVFIFLGFSFATYASSLRMAFFFGDDAARIVAAAPEFDLGLSNTITSVLPDRPVLMTTIWLNYQVCGLNVPCFRVVNLLLHALAAFALSWMLQFLFEHLERRNSRWISYGIGLLFVCHPLNTQAVTIIIQRGVLLGAMFCFLSLCFYIQGNRYLSVLCYIVALFSKPFVIVLPLIILLYNWLAQQSEKNPNQGIPKLPLWSKVSIAPFVMASALPVAFYSVLKINNQIASVGWVQYFQIQLRVIFIYLRLFLYPIHLHYLYEIPKTVSLLTTLFSFFGHALLITLAVKLRHFSKVACFGFLAMYLAFLPESGIFPIEHLAFEHRAYLPLAFFLIGCAGVLESLKIRDKFKIFLAYVSLPLLMYGTLHRMQEIDSPLKWLMNTYSYYQKDESHNRNTLKNLLDLGAIEQGRSVLAASHLLGGDQTEYRFFERLFTFEKSTHQEQVILLQDLANYLQRGGELKYPRTRHFFNLFVLRQLPKFLAGAELAQKIELLLRWQLFYITADKVLYRDELQQYERVAVDLQNEIIGRRLINGRSSPEVWRLFLRTLGGLELYFGHRNPGPGIAEQYQTLLKQFPGREGIESDSNLYRSEKDGLLLRGEPVPQ